MALSTPVSDVSVAIELGVGPAGQHPPMVLPPGGLSMQTQGAPLPTDAPFMYPPTLPPPPPPPPGHVPFYPCLVVPHIDGSLPININVPPSNDHAGADLPHNGIVLTHNRKLMVKSYIGWISAYMCFLIFFLMPFVTEIE